MVVEFSSRKKWGNVGQLCGKVGKCLTIRNLFRHSRRSTCAEAQMPEATMPRHSGVQTNDRSKVQSNVCLNIRSNARLNNQSNNQSNVRLSIRSNACLSNQSNNQSNVYLSIRSNNHLNKHSNAPSVNKPIHGNGVARPGHGYQAGRTNAQCAQSIHPLILQLKYGLHYD